jgi:Cytochrome c7 and related cytochrome c
MAQLFHPSANTIAKASIFGAIIFGTFVSYLTMGYDRSSWHSGVGERKNQPVPFSHEHHVRGLGIDCRYCHTSVESSHFAGMPSTKTCMTCHSQIWTNAALLQPVRDSWLNNRPIEWQRVHNLPEFVYFNHSIHVAKGIGCSACHGEVDTMPLMYQVNSLQMQWCLECHRNPEKFIRPRTEVYNLHYDPTTDKNLPPELQNQEALGKKLVADYHIHKEQMTNCSICHR